MFKQIYYDPAAATRITRTDPFFITAAAAMGAPDYSDDYYTTVAPEAARTSAHGNPAATKDDQDHYLDPLSSPDASQRS